MSDINYSINGQVSRGPLVQSIQASGITASMGDAGVFSVTLGLGTSTAAVDTTTLTSVGLAFLRHLGTVSTHTVSFGRLDSGTLYETVRLRGGEAAVLRLAPGNYAAKAEQAGTTRLLVQIYEG
jgi:hypothetical protein